MIDRPQKFAQYSGCGSASSLRAGNVVESQGITKGLVRVVPRLRLFELRDGWLLHMSHALNSSRMMSSLPVELRAMPFSRQSACSKPFDCAYTHLQPLPLSRDWMSSRFVVDLLRLVAVGQQSRLHSADDHAHKAIQSIGHEFCSRLID